MKIVFEDNHLLVINKPAGIPAQPDSSTDESIVQLAKDYIRQKYQKKGNIYLALLHRLDRPTSGIMILAKTEKAAGRIAEEFRNQKIEKYYHAIVDNKEKKIKNKELLQNYLDKNDKNKKMIVIKNKNEKAKKAVLEYEIIEKLKNEKIMINVKLISGVKHQIRAQMANIGCPIVGDFLYGPYGKIARPEKVKHGRAIMLHAEKIIFNHPVKKNQMILSAEKPEYWKIYNKITPL